MVKHLYNRTPEEEEAKQEDKGEGSLLDGNSPYP
jgi:hypothetical protein